MVKIIISKIARLDLKDIIDYIKRDSIKYARLERIKIEGAINKADPSSANWQDSAGT